jgi:hypothetical protein
MVIFNLTQHRATPDQVADGVVEPDDSTKLEIIELLTFDVLPTREDIRVRARDLAFLVADHNHFHGSGVDCAMIGGAPFLMGPLANYLDAIGIKPLFAFSVRESTESVQPDGSVRKVQVFRHAGFVPAL